MHLGPYSKCYPVLRWLVPNGRLPLACSTCQLLIRIQLSSQAILGSGSYLQLLHVIAVGKRPQASASVSFLDKRLDFEFWDDWHQQILVPCKISSANIIYYIFGNSFAMEWKVVVMRKMHFCSRSKIWWKGHNKKNKRKDQRIINNACCD